MMQTLSPRIPVDELFTFVEQTLRSIGVGETDAHTTADALVTTDTWGIFTHGTKLLAGYVRRLRGTGWRVDATPRIEREGPAWAVVEGEHALGQVGSCFAMRLALAKAKTVGIAYVGLKNTAHIGAAGYYANLAAKDGFIGMVMGNDIPSVAVPGSRGAVMGSNPLAYGIPVGDRDPILLDMATAAVAGGKVYAAHQRGEPIPPTWLIGPDGKPTTDGNLYPHSASLAPMAGHKGYGLALFAETLSALLPGGAMTWQVGSWIFDEMSKPSRHNAAFLAFDVNTIRPRAEFTAQLEKLIDEIHAAPKADGHDRIYVPGEMEWERRRLAMSEGIPLPSDTLGKLRELREFGVTLPTWLA